MSAKFLCPDCSKQLSDGTNRCTCGWFAVSENKSLSKEKSRYQCQHLEGDARCHKEGTVSKQIQGNHWYCSAHAHY